MWSDENSAATLWLSVATHPAEWALQDGLLHFDRYQAGHQTGQCVIDDGREGSLARGRQDENEKKEVEKSMHVEMSDKNDALAGYLELAHELL